MTQGDVAAGEQLYRDAIAIDPGYGLALFNLALLLSDQARYEESAELLGRYVAIAPEDAWGHFHLGVALAALGRLDEAGVEMQRATELDPAVIDALPTVAPSG